MVENILCNNDDDNNEHIKSPNLRDSDDSLVSEEQLVDPSAIDVSESSSSAEKKDQNEIIASESDANNKNVNKPRQIPGNRQKCKGIILFVNPQSLHIYIKFNFSWGQSRLFQKKKNK